MGQTCYYYWIIEPIGACLRDNSSTVPIWELPIETHLGELSLALFVNTNSWPAHARMKIPGLPDKTLPEALLPILQETREHLLTVLRLIIGNDVIMFPRPIYMFVADGESFEFSTEFQIRRRQLIFQAEAAKQLFAASFAYREQLRLLADGGNPAMPLQFRFLSLYRLLELELRQSGTWDDLRLDDFLSHHAPRFVEAGFARAPARTVHELRDACAHIRKGKQLGVTHLNHGQALKVEKALPILLDVCSDVLNEAASGLFKVCQRPD